MRNSAISAVKGFQLTEILVVLSLMGIVAGLSVLLFLDTTPNSEDAVTQTRTVQNLQHGLDQAESSLGLLPLDYGAAEALSTELNGMLVAEAPASCAVNAGDQSLVLASGAVVGGLSATWDDTLDYDAARPGDQSGDVACIALNGMDTAPEDIRYVTLLRTENHLSVAALATSEPTHAAASGGTSPLVSNAVPEGKATPTDDPATGNLTEDPDVSVTPGVSVIETYELRIVVRDNDTNAPIAGPVITGDVTRRVTQNLDPGDYSFNVSAAGYQMLGGSATIVDADVRVVARLIPLGAPPIVSPPGLNIVEIKSGSFGHQTFSADGEDKTSRRFENGINWAMFTANVFIREVIAGVTTDTDWLDHSHWGQFDTRRKLENETERHGNNIRLFLPEKNHERTTHGEVYYKDRENLLGQGADTIFRVRRLVHSPIKIPVQGRHATLNSQHQFAFALGGIVPEKTALAHGITPTINHTIIQTSGGLNDNEAWLVMDRENNGFLHDDVLDGNDVFGDHMGQYESGYDELATVFHAYLKTDEQGKRYIALRALTVEEERYIRVLKILDPTYKHPSYDLKLLTKSGQVIPVHQVLARVYVDYDAVEECDATEQNCIFQRAPIQFKSGVLGTSVDQWFTDIH